jgi:hypothetical protein
MRIEEVCAVFAGRLRDRRSQMESRALARLDALDAAATLDGHPQRRLPAIAAAVDYSIEVLELSPAGPPPLPPILLAEARAAAREGVALQSLVRRYLAGYALLEDFLLEEAERSGLFDPGAIRQIFEAQARVIDRVITTVGSEHSLALAARRGGARERRGELVSRLLAGELVDPTALGYDLDAIHVGLVAEGAGGRAAAELLAERMGVPSLIVERGEATVWAWLGARRGFDGEALRLELARQATRAGADLALGAPASALEGWRLTHRQADAAFGLIRDGMRRGPSFYSDVAVLACAHGDELLSSSLRGIYLAPLAARPDGAVLRETIRCYLKAGRNASSAAALLDVDRRTITSRLAAVEACFGRPLQDCLLNLQLALELSDTSRSPTA